MNSEKTPILEDSKLIDTNQNESYEENIDIRRQKKREMEKYVQEIESKNEICHQLAENIKYEKTRNNTTKNEIKLRADRLKELNEQYQAILNKDNLEMDSKVNLIKKQIIKEKLEELLDYKIPEVGLKQKRKINDVNENEFKDLIHESIKVIYTKYESPFSKINKEESKNFIISKYSIFSSLKETACSYWNLDMNEFILTDETESIIYNDKIPINEYMKNYSIRSNIIRLIKINILKARVKILPSQESRLKETNKLEIKGKGEIKRGGGGTFTQIVSEFINNYPNLKPYLLGKDPGESESDNKEVQAKDLDTSFYMLVLCFLLFILTLLQIQVPQNDVIINNKEIGYLKDLFNVDYLGGKNNILNLFYYIFKCLRTVSSSNSTESNYINNSEFNKYINEKNNNIQFDFSNCKNKINEELYECINKEFEKMSKGVELNFLSSVHLIIEKVEDKKCNEKMKRILDETYTCYYEFFTNGKKDKDEKFFNRSDYISSLLKGDNNKNLLKSLNESYQYKNSKESNIKLHYETLTGFHNGGGYHLDLPLGKNFTILNFFCVLSELFPIYYNITFCYDTEDKKKSDLNRDDFTLVNQNVRSIIILFNLIYSAEYNQMCNVLLHFDFTAAGAIINPVFRINTFIPNVYKNKSKLIIDILRLIIFIIIIVLYALEFKINKQKIDFHFLKKLLVSFHTLLLVVGFILYIGIFIVKLMNLNDNGSKYIDEEKNTYYQGALISKYYHYVNFLECIFLIIIIIKLLLFTQLIRFTNLFFRIMNKSLGMFFQYFLILIICLIGFAFMGEITWGQYYDEYSNFHISLIYTIYLIFGYYNIENKIEHIKWWGIVYIIILYIFNFVFISFILSLVLAESFRRVVKRFGYPEDDQSYDWKLKDFALWVSHYRKKNDEENK